MPDPFQMASSSAGLDELYEFQEGSSRCSRNRARKARSATVSGNYRAARLERSDGTSLEELPTQSTPGVFQNCQRFDTLAAKQAKHTSDHPHRTLMQSASGTLDKDRELKQIVCDFTKPECCLFASELWCLVLDQRR